MRSVSSGWSRTRSSSVAVSRLGLSQIAVDTPTRPRSCINPARRTAVSSSVGRPNTRAASVGQVRDAPRMTGQIRGLQVRQVRHRLQDDIQLGPADPAAGLRFDVEHRVPVRGLVHPVEHLGGRRAEQVRQRRVELGARVPADHRHRRLRAVAPAEHLHRTGQLHQPRRQPDPFPGQLGGNALAVPLLVGLADGDADRRVEADPLGEPGTHRRVRGHEPEHQPLPPERERHQPPRPRRRAAVRCEPADEEREDLRGVPAQRLDTLGLETDVVVEPRRLLRRVGMAMGVHQQARGRTSSPGPDHWRRRARRADRRSPSAAGNDPSAAQDPDRRRRTASRPTRRSAPRRAPRNSAGSDRSITRPARVPVRPVHQHTPAPRSTPAQPSITPPPSDRGRPNVPLRRPPTRSATPFPADSRMPDSTSSSHHHRRVIAIASPLRIRSAHGYLSQVTNHSSGEPWIFWR